MEDSHIPLNKWVLAFYLVNSSKKGMSAHQIHRTLGISYKTAWFLCHRIREAMDPIDPNAASGPLGGAGKIVEVDEAVVGGKAKNRALREPAPKKSVVTLLSAARERARSTSRKSTPRTFDRSWSRTPAGKAC
jgi:hypothetical protein